MLKVESYYDLKKGQKVRLTSNDGDAVLTGTVERVETGMAYAIVGGVEIREDLTESLVNIEVDDTFVLPTTLGSVIKLDDAFLVLNDDGWGSPDYWYEEDEYEELVAKKPTLVFDAAVD